MPQLQQPWTAAMVRELPADGKRYEVVSGELLVTPAPTFDHQEAVGNLFLRLRVHLRAHLVGHAAMSPADIELDTHTLVQPDVFVVPLVQGRRPRTWAEIPGLLLAVEVLSPSTARADRTIKRRRFQAEGVHEYWIVDVEARLVERWRPEDLRPEILTETLVWQPDPAVEPLVVSLPDFFNEVLGAA
ncbi:MAG TPA: Uma2 family endonuclease [Gemmatimonadales bacterium]|nr:Uma2 family endonuclease [Gemmatimonadales bacterium]